MNKWRKTERFVCLLGDDAFGATNDGGMCDSVSWYEGLLKIECPLIIAYETISHKNRA